MIKLINVLILLLFLIIADVAISDSIPSIGGDPDENRSFMEIVNAHGYPCENHFVTTVDGYILQVFRIRNGRSNASPTTPKQPVLLQHGLLDSSITWIINEPSESLAYILADAGYDVWLGNNRGNTYSTNHTSLPITSPEFWRFSFDEMGWFDMPATINYIREFTGFATLPYVGHSEGTIQAFIGYTVNSSLAEWAPLFIGVGPVGNVTHITNNGLAELAKLHIDTLLEVFGENRFLPTPEKLREIFIDFCVECDECCATVVEFLCGKHRGAFNDSRMPVVAGHEPAGTSVQNIRHWAQDVRNKQLQMFDHGPVGNMEHYHQLYPPIYNVSNFPTNVKIALFSGGLDELADPVDVQDLVNVLPAESLIYWQKIADYAHLDYVWALDAHITMYPTVVSLIQKYFPNSQHNE